MEKKRVVCHLQIWLWRVVASTGTTTPSTSSAKTITPAWISTRRPSPLMSGMVFLCGLGTATTTSTSTRRRRSSPILLRTKSFYREMFLVCSKAPGIFEAATQVVAMVVGGNSGHGGGRSGRGGVSRPTASAGDAAANVPAPFRPPRTTPTGTRGGRAPSPSVGTACQSAAPMTSGGTRPARVSANVEESEDQEEEDEDEALGNAISGKSEWKKLKHGPPENLGHLQQMFEHVAIDGSSSCIPGEHIGGAEDEAIEEDGSPMSTSSRKRAGSVNDTVTSPEKKTKSPMVRIMKGVLESMKSDSASTQKVLQTIKPDKELMAESMKRAQGLIVDCGAAEDSVEYFTAGQLFLKAKNREFFCNITIKEGRIMWLKRCQMKNMY